MSEVLIENNFFDYIKKKGKKLRQKVGEEILTAAALTAGLGTHLLKNKPKRKK